MHEVGVGGGGSGRLLLAYRGRPTAVGGTSLQKRGKEAAISTEIVSTMY